MASESGGAASKKTFLLNEKGCRSASLFYSCCGSLLVDVLLRLQLLHQSFDLRLQRVGSAVGKPGPIPRPWMRKSTATWCVWIGKRQVNLGKDYNEALRKMEILLTADLGTR